MKRFLFLLILTVLLCTHVHAQKADEFGNVKPKPEVVKPRHDLALSLGLPGGINVAYTLPFSRKFGTRLTGGGFYLDNDIFWYGGQIEAFYVLKHTKEFTADLSLGIGDTEFEVSKGFSISYWGVLGTFRHRSIFLQLGVGTIIQADGDYHNDLLFSYQLGVILVRF